MTDTYSRPNRVPPLSQHPVDPGYRTVPGVDSRDRPRYPFPPSPPTRPPVTVVWHLHTVTWSLVGVTVSTTTGLGRLSQSSTLSLLVDDESPLTRRTLTHHTPNSVDGTRFDLGEGDKVSASRNDTVLRSGSGSGSGRPGGTRGRRIRVWCHSKTVYSRVSDDGSGPVCGEYLFRDQYCRGLTHLASLRTVRLFTSSLRP